MDITTQVVNVTTATTRNGRVRWDVATAMGSYACWDGQLAQNLQQWAMGQPVTLRINQKPKNDGSGMWEDIKAFAPPGAQLPPEQNGMPQAGVQQPRQQGGQGGQQYTPEVTARISKLACIEYAANLVGHLMAGAGPEQVAHAQQLTDMVAGHFYDLARRHEDAPVPFEAISMRYSPGSQAQPVTGAQIASQTAGVSLGMPVQANVDPLVDEDRGWD